MLFTSAGMSSRKRMLPTASACSRMAVAFTSSATDRAWAKSSRDRRTFAGARGFFSASPYPWVMSSR